MAESKTLHPDQESLVRNLFSAIDSIPNKHQTAAFAYISGLTTAIAGLGELFKEARKDDKRAG